MVSGRLVMRDAPFLASPYQEPPKGVLIPEKLEGETVTREDTGRTSKKRNEETTESWEIKDKG